MVDQPPNCWTNCSDFQNDSSSIQQKEGCHFWGNDVNFVPLAQSDDKDDEKANEVYNYTSVSKVFKNFCSTLVCEFLMRIGAMLKKEIETRGIKTVNDTVISTVISHYHIVSGVGCIETIRLRT